MDGAGCTQCSLTFINWRLKLSVCCAGSFRTELMCVCVGVLVSSEGSSGASRASSVSDLMRTCDRNIFPTEREEASGKPGERYQGQLEISVKSAGTS